MNPYKDFKVLNFGVKDQQGDIFTVKEIELKRKNFIITRDFNPSEMIGLCKLTVKNDGLYAVNVRFKDKIDPKGLYPAIGFIRKKGETQVKINQISVCKSRNMDVTINKL